MTRSKPSKKTESLEVPLPHAVKRAFMARARSQGRTARALVREFIDSYLAGTDPRDGGLDPSEYGAMMSHLPGELAGQAASFAEVDTDSDGVIAWQEFLG